MAALLVDRLVVHWDVKQVEQMVGWMVGLSDEMMVGRKVAS